jgi:preprotein translocase SecE subunit
MEQALSKSDPDFPPPVSRGGEKTVGDTGGGLIYKYGRGYWVRMLSAIALGVLTLATAAWLWKQSEAFALPTKGHTLSITSPPKSPPAVGQTVQLIAPTTQGGVQGEATIGSATITGYASAGSREGVLSIGKPAMSEGKAIADAKTLALADGTRLPVSRSAGIPIFERTYLQGALAALALLAGGWLTYRYVGTKPSSVEFLIATDEEMRKVNWSTRKAILDYATIVIAATFIVAFLIFVIDLFLKFSIMDRIVGKSS